ncbi:Tfp pilus assembly protein PilF [Desulfatibacillum alkenivorans DSM 16219]|uniref:Tfp pilus assembly protein PilF n=1 Tax=Desulfatibacillum alkenivorans DSM 16219 TaxID=1121393 RepID=A0A1M6M8A6_9BACT|nr:tetratricopeptide repeat protein [Desulfatibacillum alkenivorans]SHJ79695.1 Tfp pilus assembly protein PilF [Desulfatibacillum alkenivorans DSM 16219]
MNSNNEHVETASKETPAPQKSFADLLRDNQTLTACLLIALAVLFVYWSLPGHEFINLDDKVQILENNDLHRGLASPDIGWMFSVSQPRDYWYPLTWLSLAANYQFGGLNPWGYHLVNLLLHLASAWLLFFALKIMTKRLWPSALVALLFAVHPLNVEAVAWAVQRKSTLSGFFIMLFFLSYARYTAKPQWSRYAWVCLCFLGALMSKAPVMPVMFALFLLDYWPLYRTPLLKGPEEAPLASLFGGPDKPWRALILEKAPLLLLCLGVGYLNYLAFSAKGQIVDAQEVGYFLRLENALYSCIAYMGKTLWPRNLSIFYPMPESMSLAKPLAALALLVLATGACLHLRRKRPYLIVGWLWYLGIILPYLGLFFRTGVFPAMVDRALYLPGVGLFIMLVWGALDLLKSKNIPKPAMAILAALLIAAPAFAAKRQVYYWQNSMTLFSQARDNTRGNYLAHHCVGIEYMAQGRYDQAIEEFRKTLEINPSYLKARFNLAASLKRLGRLDQALAELQKGLLLPDYKVRTHCKIGALLVDMGRFKEALQHFSMARDLAPNDSNVYNNLGMLSLKLEESKEARDFFARAIQLDPRNFEAYNNMGSLLAAAGQDKEAASYIQAALSLAPRSVDALNNMASIYFKTGNIEAGANQLNRILEIEPENIEVRRNLALLMLKTGNPLGARDQLKTICYISPDDFDAQYLLATVLISLGRLEEAYTHLSKALEINPDHPETHNKMAAVLYNLGCQDDAIRHLETALKINPAYENARLNLELIKSRQKEQKQ